jgi:hypothetical protein
MSHTGWITLLEVYDVLEAEIIKEALEAEGLPAALFHESVGSLYPTTFGLLNKVEICVPESHQAAAQAWLEAYNQGELRDDHAELGDPDHE